VWVWKNKETPASRPSPTSTPTQHLMKEKEIGRNQEKEHVMKDAFSIYHPKRVRRK